VWAVVGGHEYEEWGAYCDYHNKPVHEKPYLIDSETTGDPFPEEPIPFTCFEYEYKGKSEWTGYQEYIEKMRKENEALYAEPFRIDWA